jgi:hypothetical protein
VAETGVPAGWLPLHAIPPPPPGLPPAVLRHLADLPGPFPPCRGTPMPAETGIEARALALGVHPLALIDEPPTAAERQAWLEDGLMVRVLRAIGDEVWLAGAPRPELGTDLHPAPHEWLAERFFEHHTARFKRRPIVWHLGRLPGQGCFVHAHALARMGLQGLAQRVPPDPAFQAALQATPWAPEIDAGVRVNIAPLQLAGLLARPVLTAADARKALAQREAWRG